MSGDILTALLTLPFTQPPSKTAVVWRGVAWRAVVVLGLVLIVMCNKVSTIASHSQLMLKHRSSL